MAQEVVVIAEAMANWKQFCLAIAGFFVRILWFWQKPINWPRVIAGLIFLMGGFYLITQYVHKDYTGAACLLLGLFVNNIIAGLFRWWGVNEDALMEYTRNWWKSGKK